MDRAKQPAEATGSGRNWVTVCLVLLVAATACRSAFRHPAEPYRGSRPKEELLLEGMNPYLLTNVLSNHLVVEVDWIDDAEPHAKALEALSEALQEHCATGKRIEVVLGNRVPLQAWTKLPDGFATKGPLIADHLAHDPTDWEQTEVVYVLFVPGESELTGWTVDVPFERDGEVRVVPTVFLFSERIAEVAALLVTPRKVEQAALVHEMGHVLGLVSNPDHQERDNPFHCTEPQCVMAYQRLRGQIYNALPETFAGVTPNDYGDKCRADIERVKSIWVERAGDPGFRDELIARRRSQELETRACWYVSHDRWSEALDSLAEARRLRERDAIGSDGEPDSVQTLSYCPK
jgi:hypothetical protein